MGVMQCVLAPFSPSKRAVATSIASSQYVESEVCRAVIQSRFDLNGGTDKEHV